jgi:prophage regulatory protein
MTNSPTPPTRFVTIKEFSRRSSLCRSSIYNLVKRHEISPPRRLTPKRVGWPEHEVDAWLAARMQPEQAAA